MNVNRRALTTDYQAIGLEKASGSSLFHHQWRQNLPPFKNSINYPGITLLEAYISLICQTLAIAISKTQLSSKINCGINLFAQTNPTEGKCLNNIQSQRKNKPVYSGLESLLHFKPYLALFIGLSFFPTSAPFCLFTSFFFFSPFSPFLTFFPFLGKAVIMQAEPTWAIALKE